MLPVIFPKHGKKRLFPGSFGSTFYKQFDKRQGSLNADFAKGSKTATFTASRGASNPATTIEKQSGNALLFDGVDDNVNVSGSDAIKIYGSTAYSISATINAQSAGSGLDGYILDTDGNGAIEFRLDQPSANLAKVLCKVDYGTGTDALSKTNSQVIAFGTKHNIVAVFNEDGNNKIKIYVDGALQTLDEDTAGIGTIDDDSSDDKIIGNNVGNNEEFDGQIYDLAIYRNKALSASEVLAIHNGGAKTGATAHWDFSDASGSTLTDIVGSNNGTITGAKWLTSGSTYITKVTADDTPRFTQGYYDDSGYTSAPGLLLEGASTNLITHGIFDADAGSGLATGWSSSDNVTNAPTFSLVEEDFTNISGSQAQRWQQTFGDGTYAQIFQQTAVGTVAQGETVTISVWLKGTLTGITSLKLRMLEMDASSVGGTNHLSSDIKGDISATEWRRFSYTITASDADASLVRAYPSVANHSGSGSIDLQIAGAQVEQAAYPSSLIPTTASALTRNIEALSYPVASNFVGGTDGSIALVYRPIMLPDEQGSNYRKLFLVTVDASNAWQYGYRTNADDKIRLSTISGGPETYAESSAEPFSSSRYGLHSIIGTYSTTADASSKKLNNYIDGSLDGTNANYTVPVGSLPAAFQIQSSDNQAMILTGIALFNKRLDATQAAKVDSILT